MALLKYKSLPVLTEWTKMLHWIRKSNIISLTWKFSKSEFETFTYSGLIYECTISEQKQNESYCHTLDDSYLARDYCLRESWRKKR